jgi:hypothetical protein
MAESPDGPKADDASSSPPKQVVKKARKRRKRRTKGEGRKRSGRPSGAGAAYPRHSPRKALRVPRALLDQNAGRACSDREAAAFCGVKWGGPFAVEISSGLKYGFLRRPQAGQVEPTDLAKKVLRPQSSSDEIDALREAIQNGPVLGDVYRHYRGENVPDDQFFRNALIDTFRIPTAKADEFKGIFLEALADAQLIEDVAGKKRVLDVATGSQVSTSSDETLRKIAKGVKIDQGDSCFVVMPFAEPIGGYYKTVYEPAIVKAGLRPVRADDEIFATGKIVDQVWSGIAAAKVLVAELTGRNPNVFYELGLAHALEKPVVLVSSNQEDVPFDLQQIRVIYNDKRDPFWGEKLIAKVAENVLSAVKNPGEAIFRRAVQPHAV